MRKILLAVMILALSSVAHAAGTLVKSGATFNQDGTTVKSITFTFTADASNGSVPAYTFSAYDLSEIQGLYIYEIETDPGSTAPTDNWDITITNWSGRDILGGACTNRDASASEACTPKSDGVNYKFPPIDNKALSLNVSGNSVNSATGTIKIWFDK